MEKICISGCGQGSFFNVSKKNFLKIVLVTKLNLVNQSLAMYFGVLSLKMMSLRVTFLSYMHKITLLLVCIVHFKLSSWRREKSWQEISSWENGLEKGKTVLPEYGKFGGQN